MRRIFRDDERDAAFRRDGYVVLDLFDRNEVGRLIEFYGQFHAQHSDEFTTTVFTDDLEVRRRVHEGVAAAYERTLLPLLDDYRIALGSFAVKQPHATFSKVGLHQDFTFVDEEAMVGLSLWCPLIDVDLRNGCLGVVRGSHLFNTHRRDPCFLPYLDLLPVIEQEYMSYLRLRAGQGLVMDNRLFHGSNDNHSEHTRIVAAGIAVPRESQLFYCHRDRDGDDSVLEVYEVPPDFYTRHSINTRPLEGHHVATVPRRVETLTLDLLRSQFTPASSEDRNLID
jgi:hypothetical protein